MSEPLDSIFEGLRREKERIALTDEMSRRAGLDIKIGRRVLAAAKLSSNGVDMKAVAWGIKRAAEMRLQPWPRHAREN